MTTKDKIRKYFLQVSAGDEKFAEEMSKELYSYVKKEIPKTGSTMLILFGSDLELIAQMAGMYVDLTKYFLLEDLEVFEMEVSVSNGEITQIVYVDAPRKHPASI